METLSSTAQAEMQTETQTRRRGRKPGQPVTPRELAARRANLEKARAALQEGDRRTEKRLRASRANLEKAIAARGSPEGNAAPRLNALKHGLFAEQTLAESIDRLGEDKQEFDLHLRLFERVFAPADEEEKRIVRGLAQTVWRRLRLLHAQAWWEKERLYSMFAEAPAPERLSLDDTVARADGLTLALMEFEAFYRQLDKLESRVEFWLRRLIRKRSRGKLRWKGFSPRRDPVMKQFEEEERMNRLVEVWDTMSPKEQAAVREEARKEVAAREAEREKQCAAGD